MLLYYADNNVGKSYHKILCKTSWREMNYSEISHMPIHHTFPGYDVLLTCYSDNKYY